MKVISEILFWISTGLLIPVIVMLIFLFVRALLLAGSFFGEYVEMRKVRPVMKLAMKNGAVDVETVIKQLPGGKHSVVGATLDRLMACGGNEREVNRVIGEFETYSAEQLSVPNMLSKMGPTIGLMGTLIPMGPALVGLAAGDIASMAYNMQVAFATTVVGLCSAVIGYLVLSVRKRWYTKELMDIEYIGECMIDKVKKA